MPSPHRKIHPGYEWAEQQNFSESDVDCTTAVVLKILDGKCKMSEGEKMFIMEIYDVAKYSPGKLFDVETHNVIYKARYDSNIRVKNHVHARRLFAEKNIPKPVMKQYKDMLRDGLFG